MNATALYADIILPIGLPDPLTYRIPKAYEQGAAVGKRVVVPCKKKILIGIIWQLHRQPPPAYRLRDVVALPDEEPLWDAHLCRLMTWMQDYYLCRLGKVARLALEPLKELLTPHLTCSAEGRAILSTRRDLADMTWQDVLADWGVDEGIAFLQSGCEKGLISLAPDLPKASVVPSLPHASGADAPHTATFSSLLTTVGQAITQQGTLFLQGGSLQERTAIYQEVIAPILQQGGQVLYLVPDEVAVRATHAELVHRYARDLIRTYAPHMSGGKRGEVARAVMHPHPLCVVGRLGALLLPFSRLQLIIMRQATSLTYRQVGAEPHYDGLAVASMRAHYHKIPFLMGDVLPSVRMYHHVQEGRCQLLDLGPCRTKRIEITHPPEGKMKGASRVAPVAPRVIEAIQSHLDQQRPVVILHARRGYAHYHICPHCYWVARCPTCRVSFTYHEPTHRLFCHYCHKSHAPYPACPSCKSASIQQRGMGIQQLKELLPIHFPHYPITCVDADAPQGQSLRKVRRLFAKGDIPILLGTRQLIRELPTEKKALIVLLDQGEWISRYHPYGDEHALQEMAQMSSGEDYLLIQTNSQATRRLVHYLQDDEVTRFYARALQERALYDYPPFRRLVQIVLFHTTPRLLWSAADALAHALKEKFNPAGPFLHLPTLADKKVSLALSIALSPKNLTSQKKELQKAVIHWQTTSHPKVSIRWQVDPL